MGIDYKPLWHLLLDRKMSKTELRLEAGSRVKYISDIVVYVLRTGNSLKYCDKSVMIDKMVR